MTGNDATRARAAKLLTLSRNLLGDKPWPPVNIHIIDEKGVRRGNFDDARRLLDELEAESAALGALDGR